MRNQIDKKTFDISSGIDERVYEEQLITTIKKESFAERMKRYCDYKTGENKFDIIAEMIASSHPELKAYYDELGADRIKALGYKESSLKNEIKNRQETGHLILEFKRIFKPGMRLTSEDVKL